jgi:hypothetical protein
MSIQIWGLHFNKFVCSHRPRCERFKFKKIRDLFCAFTSFSLTSTGWVSYVLCGVKGVMELLAEQGRNPVALQMAVAGNIPPGSGLSSSSALVCAGALATALANQVNNLYLVCTLNLMKLPYWPVGVGVVKMPRHSNNTTQTTDYS